MKYLLFSLPLALCLLGWLAHPGRRGLLAAGVGALASLAIILAWLEPVPGALPAPKHVDLIVLHQEPSGQTPGEERDRLEGMLRSQLEEKDSLHWVDATRPEEVHRQLLLSGDEVATHLLILDRGKTSAEEIPRGLRIGVTSGIWEDPSGFELEEVVLPEKVRSGRPFTLGWKVYSIRPVTGRLEISIGEEVTEEVPVFSAGGTLAGGKQIVLNKPGTYPVRLAARAGLAPNRPAAILGYLEVLPPPRLFLSGNLQPMGEFFREMGYELADPAAGLATEVDAAILSPSGPVPEGLVEFLRGGGGLLILAGPDPAPWSGEEFLSLLPVSFHPRIAEGPAPGPGEEEPGSQKQPPPETDSQPPREDPGKPPSEEITSPRKEEREAGIVALVLILDKSGSMAGKKLHQAKQAALATARTIEPEDYLGVLAFDHEVEEIVPMKPLRDQPNYARLIEKLEHRGATRLFPALKKGAGMLAESPAAIRHLIILSDGETEDSNSVSEQEIYRNFVTSLARNGITTSTVFVRGGNELDPSGARSTAFLSKLADWGLGRYYYTRVQEIPQVFTMEANRIRDQVETGGEAKVPGEKETPESEPEEPVKEPEPDPGPESFERRFTPALRDPHPVLEGVELSGAPRIGGYLGSRLKQGASLPLILKESGEPLLAVWPHRQGRVGVWTSDAGGAWSGDLFGDSRMGRLFSQLVEYLRRRDGERSDPWQLECTEDGVRLVPIQESVPLPENGLLRALFTELPGILETPLVLEDSLAWASGGSRPVAGGKRSWSLGSLPEEGLVSAAQARESAARLADSLGGALLVDEQALQDFVVREIPTALDSRRALYGWAAVLLLVLEGFLVLGPRKKASGAGITSRT